MAKYCPKCGSISKHIGALNYKETEYWRSRGTVSGGGVLFGSGGVGVGIGGGSTSSSGTRSTKRARVFAEPERSDGSKVLTAIIFGFILILTMLGAPMLIDAVRMTGPVFGGNTTEEGNMLTLAESAAKLLPVLMPVGVLAAIVYFFINVRQAS